MWKFKQFKPYRDRPYCFIDVEGTGLKPGYHEITEVGAFHTEKGNLSLQIAPRYMSRAQPEALKISGYNSSDWAEAISFREASHKIAEFLDGSTVIGHNIFGYDIPMLKGNFDMVELSSADLFKDCIDTMMLARVHLVPLGLNLLSMKACMKFIGSEYEGAHTAYEDSIFAKKLFDHIMENVKWYGKKDGKRIQESLF